MWSTYREVELIDESTSHEGGAPDKWSTYNQVEPKERSSLYTDGVYKRWSLQICGVCRQMEIIYIYMW